MNVSENMPHMLNNIRRTELGCSSVIPLQIALPIDRIDIMLRFELDRMRYIGVFILTYLKRAIS